MNCVCLPLRALFVIALAAIPPAVMGQSGRLNDTGQTSCYTGPDCKQTQEDGRYGRDAAQAAGKLPAKKGGGAAGFDFSCVRWNGAVVNAASCTTTLVANTGASATSTPATDWACTRDNVTDLVWSLQSQTASWDAASADGYADAGHNASSRCGYGSGWRLPTRRELLSIVHHGAESPAIDSSYFPFTEEDYYWSSDSYAPNAAYAWYVDFELASSYVAGKTYSFQLRLVRSAN